MLSLICFKYEHNLETFTPNIYCPILKFLLLGECGIRGGYAEVIKMDEGVMAMLQKSISAKLCPTVIGNNLKHNI